MASSGMAYRYATIVGIFILRPQPGSQRFQLWISGQCYATYITVAAAVADINAHATGLSTWDLQPKLKVPTDLSQWEKIE